jgi:hypothetical protein
MKIRETFEYSIPNKCDVMHWEFYSPKQDLHYAISVKITSKEIQSEEYFIKEVAYPAIFKLYCVMKDKQISNNETIALEPLADKSSRVIDIPLDSIAFINEFKNYYKSPSINA